MANAFQGSPPIWVLDTASNTPVSTDWVRIYRIKWVVASGGTAGDQCLIEDANGKEIFNDYNTVGTEYDSGDFTFESAKGKPFNGVILKTLSSGVVTIYLA